MKGVYRFEPNAGHHKEFADALNYARSKGVKVLVYDCLVTPDSIEIDKQIEY
jgi:sugar fermentation stimulation protein A